MVSSAVEPSLVRRAETNENQCPDQRMSSIGQSILQINTKKQNERSVKSLIILDLIWWAKMTDFQNPCREGANRENPVCKSAILGDRNLFEPLAAHPQIPLDPSDKFRT